MNIYVIRKPQLEQGDIIYWKICHSKITSFYPLSVLSFILTFYAICYGVLCNTLILMTLIFLHKMQNVDTRVKH